MPFETLKLDELTELVRDHIRTRIAGADVAPFTDYDISARIIAALYHGNQSQGEYLARQILPSTAEAEFLAAHAAIRGIARRGKTKSVGTVMMLADVAGRSQSAGSQLVHASGAKYTLDGTQISATPGFSGKTVGTGSTPSRLLVLPDTTSMAIGQIISHGGVNRVIKDVISAVRAIDLYSPLPANPTTSGAINPVTGMIGAITAVDAGAAGNKPALDTLTLSTPGTGVTAATTLIEAMGGGGDVETDAELRARVVAFVALRPGAGNQADFVAWALETPDVRVDQAFVFPELRGLGTVDVVILGPALARYLGSVVRTKVAAYLATKQAWADDVNVRSIEFESSQQTIDVSVEPLPGYEPDWTGTFTLGGGSHTTTRVFVTSTPVGTIEVGDRVLVPVAGPVVNAARLEQRKASAVTSTYVDLDAPLSALPDGTIGVLRPGGPLAQPVIDAIVGFMDLLGPGIGPMIPAPRKRYPPVADGFDGELRRARLSAAILDVEGVADVSITTPASDQVANAPNQWALDHIVLRHV